MIYSPVHPDAPIDQGDLIDDCPILDLLEQPAAPGESWNVDYGFRRVVVLTQTCDLANQKTLLVNVAEAVDAVEAVGSGLLKPADIKGPLRSGRIWGLYFLPASEAHGLPEMIVDLRRLHTVRLEILRGLCRSGQRKARLPTPYREHLAKHSADSFSRIGLPRPYETL